MLVLDKKVRWLPVVHSDGEGGRPPCAYGRKRRGTYVHTDDPVSCSHCLRLAEKTQGVPAERLKEMVDFLAVLAAEPVKRWDSATLGENEICWKLASHGKWTAEFGVASNGEYCDRDGEGATPYLAMRNAVLEEMDEFKRTISQIRVLTEEDREWRANCRHILAALRRVIKRTPGPKRLKVDTE